MHQSSAYDKVTDKCQLSTKVYKRHGKDVSNTQDFIWLPLEDKEPTWKLGKKSKIGYIYIYIYK